jgi:hypothetical protein
MPEDEGASDGWDVLQTRHPQGGDTVSDYVRRAIEWYDRQNQGATKQQRDNAILSIKLKHSHAEADRSNHKPSAKEREGL